MLLSDSFKCQIQIYIGKTAYANPDTACQILTPGNYYLNGRKKYIVCE